MIENSNRTFYNNSNLVTLEQSLCKLVNTASIYMKSLVIGLEADTYTYTFSWTKAISQNQTHAGLYLAGSVHTLKIPGLHFTPAS